LEDLSLVEEVMTDIRKGERPSLESLSEYFDNFTAAKLSEITKLVTKAIKNVTVESFVEVQEVSLNPFMRVFQQLQVIQ
jgi:ribosome maturation protein Sdo1